MTVARTMSRCIPVVAALALACSSPDSQTGPDFGKAGSGPAVTAATPASATQDTTLDVQVSGSGFDTRSTVQLLLGGVADTRVKTNSTRYVSATALVANITVAPDAVMDSYDVAVTTGGGKKGIGSDLFVVTLRAEALSGSGGGSSAKGVSRFNGFVSGSVSSSCPSGRSPAVWNQAGTLFRLPELPGTCGGDAAGVNSAGVAVGFVSSSTRSYSVRWVPAGDQYVAEPLPDLPAGTNPGPWAIADDGSIVAVNDAAVLLPGAEAWRMLEHSAGSTVCRAMAVNTAGMIAGRCSVGGLQRAVVWNSAGAAPVFLPVPSGGNGDTFAGGINEAGVVVGAAHIGTARSYLNHAVRWDGNGTTWTVALLPDLGAGSSASGINSAGVVVGDVTASGYQHRPTMWDDLTSFRQLDGSVGIAYGISEPGTGTVIGGYVTSGGDQVAAVWHP